MCEYLRGKCRQCEKPDPNAFQTWVAGQWNTIVRNKHKSTRIKSGVYAVPIYTEPLREEVSTGDLMAETIKKVVEAFNETEAGIIFAFTAEEEVEELKDKDK